MTNDKGPAIIKDFRYNSSTLTVDIVLKLTPDQMQKAEAEGFDKRFKLSSTIATSNMVCFDREGRLRKYGSAEEIISDFYSLRLRYYQLRKEKLAEQLGRELQRADNRARFVLEIIQKKLAINNRKRADIIKDLRDRDYTPIPKEVKVRVAGDLDSEEAADRAASEDSSDYDYLLSMPIWNLTLEKVQKLLQEKGDIQLKLEQLLAKTPTDIWNEDLDIVERQWNDMVAEYEQRLLDDEEDRRNQEGGKGKGKARARARKTTATTATTAIAGAKRKATTAMKTEDNGGGPSQPAAKRAKSISSVSKTAARRQASTN
ncbi:DNA topoisomerase 2, partial [Linderina pennispora]